MNNGSGKDVSVAKSILEQGGLVAIPTETVYGLAANGFDEKAVAKIFFVKNRPTFNPLILHTDTLEKVKEFTSFIPDKAMILARKFWPGPLTLLLPKSSKLPSITNAGLDSVAIRIPNHSMTLDLLRSLDFPLAAPSANPFGYISPTSSEHVSMQLGEKIEYVLDGGESKVGLESTIVSVEGEKVFVHRLGGLSVEAIEAEIGPVELQINSSSNPKAPGMLKSHYAPSVPLVIGDLDELISRYIGKKIGVLSFDKAYKEVAKNWVLSKNSDFSEAAINLYKALRDLDQMDLDIIVAEYLPNKSLGLAINDRLNRAAAN